MSSNDFFIKNKLNIKTITNKSFFQALPSLSLSDVRINLRDVPFESVIGIINLHPTRRTH